MSDLLIQRDPIFLINVKIATLMQGGEMSQQMKGNASR